MTQSLPDVRNADLPALYEKAKKSLAECANVDECKDWADKARALASYARQSQDRILFDHASRIALRATRRCGELLKQVPQDPGGRPPKTQVGGGPSIGRAAAAEQAGLSDRQAKTALRVASVPERKFERLTESPGPPTVTEMAKMGTAKRPERPTPEKFAETTQILGALRRFVEKSELAAPRQAASAVLKHERVESERNARAASKWLGDFLSKLKEQ